MKIIETERTILRELAAGDGAFVLDLLNQPSFIRNIGDRNVRTIDEARDYIDGRFTESYKKFGFGMWAVELKETNEAIGICGFVKRDSLPDADIGFALLPQFERKGLAYESAAAVMRYGKSDLNFNRVLAIVSQENENSIRLLEKLDFKYERLFKLPGVAEELKLFSLDDDSQ